MSSDSDSSPPPTQSSRPPTNNRSVHNQALPINTLPPELLVQILRQAIELPTDYKNLCRLIQVCAYWHDLITNTPLFWTAIPLYPAHVIPLFVERSNPAGVMLRYAIPKGMQKPVVSSLPEYRVWKTVMDRTKNLHLTLPRDNPSGSSCFEDWFAGSRTSQLQELTLRIAGGKKQPVHVFPQPATHPLRSVDLQNVRFPYAPGQYAGLKRLHLDMGRPNKTHSMDGSILQIFRDSPDLEDLKLESDKPLGKASSRPTSEQEQLPIALPMLKRVELRLSSPDLSHILSSIFIPDTCSYLYINVADVTAHRLHTIIGENPENMANLRGLKQCFIDLMGVTIRFSRDAHEDTSPTHTATFWAQYIWYKMAYVNAVFDWVGTMEALHPSNQISCMVLRGLKWERCGNDAHHLAIFRHALQNAAVERLVVQGCDTDMVDVLEYALEKGFLKHEIELVFKKMTVNVQQVLDIVTDERNKRWIRRLRFTDCIFADENPREGMHNLERLREVYGDDLELVGTDGTTVKKLKEASWGFDPERAENLLSRQDFDDDDGGSSGDSA